MENNERIKEKRISEKPNPFPVLKSKRTKNKTDKINIKANKIAVVIPNLKIGSFPLFMF